jgi:phosphoglycerate dehydrogenase-like enzyme
MVRVGVDEYLSPELVRDFPREAEIVYIPRNLSSPVEVEFLILPFFSARARSVFQDLRGVKVIQSMMAGVDWIVPWLPKDVILCDGRGLHDISTSEWVLAAVLSHVKRFPRYRDLQNEEKWVGQSSVSDGYLHEKGLNAGQYRVLTEDLWGRTVLIVGYGSIGSAIERRLTAFDVKVLRIARTAKTEPPVSSIDKLHELLPQADVVVLIVPQTPQTTGLIGEAELKLMKPGSLLVNAARGPVVQTDALLDALRSGHIHTVMDVTDPEPLPDGHPLWTAPNCMITPHVAGSTPEFIKRAFKFGAEQVQRYINGEPLENRVGEAGY